MLTSFWKTKLLCVLALSGTALSASDIILQTANNTTGNQAYSGVGVRFQVNTTVIVSELGIFDSDQDGIFAAPGSPLSAYLLTGTGGFVASQTFDSVTPGTLEGYYRFKEITPVALLPGTYVLVGYGWTGADLEHNCNINGACETFNDGGGLLTYLDSPYGGGADAPGTLPTNTTGATNFFSAANMEYDSVPEPSSLLLLGTGLLVGLGGSVKRYVKRNRTLRG